VAAPVARQRGRADSSFVLQAKAYADTAARIGDGRIRWLSGRHVLLTKASGSVLLPAGRQQLTVEARDASGRVGRARVTVIVAPAAPRFTRISGPTTVRLRARKVTLRFAAAFPSVLTIAGKRTLIGPTATNVVVKLPRRGLVIRVPIRLSSGSKVLRGRVTITRRP
jgi:hypothetical protein